MLISFKARMWVAASLLLWPSMDSMLASLPTFVIGIYLVIMLTLIIAQLKVKEVRLQARTRCGSAGATLGWAVALASG